MPIKIPQLKERALPATTGVSTPNANAFGANVLQATGQFNDQLDAQMIEQQERENETRAREAENVLIQKMADLETGYTQLDGKAAYEAQGDYTKALAKLKQEAMDGLNNDAQRRLLAPVAERRVIDRTVAGQRHAADSFKKWEISQLGAQANLNGEAASTNWGTPEGNDAMLAMMENIRDAGERANLPPETVQLNQDKAQSAAIKQAINMRLESDPYGAARIFREAKDNMLAADRAVMDKAVQSYVDKRAAFDISDSLIAEAGGDLQSAWERSKELNDPERRAAVQKIIQSEIRVKEHFEAQAKKDMAESTWQTVLNNPTRASLPATDVVDPAVYMSMERYIEKKERGEQIEDNDVLVNDLLLMGKEEFQAVDFAKHRHELSASTLSNMLKRQAGDPKETRTQTSAAELRKRGLALVGISTKKAPEASAIFGADLDLALQDATEAKGGKLTATEQNAILQRQVYMHKTKIEIDGSGLFVDDDKRLGEYLQEHDLVDLDGNPVPTYVIEALVRRMEADGLDLTTDNIKAQLRAKKVIK